MDRRTKRFLKAIEDFQQEHDRPPSSAELAEKLGFSAVGNMAYRLGYLEAHGWITTERTSRGTLVPGTARLTPLGMKAIVETMEDT